MKAILFYFIAILITLPCFAFTNRMLAALEASGQLKVERGFGCPDDLVALRLYRAKLICVGREEVPESVLNEVLVMAEEQYDNKFGETDFRITRMEILSQISTPVDVNNDLEFVAGLASVFGIPQSSLNPDNIEVYNSLESGGFLNVPDALSMSGMLADFPLTETGKYVDTMVGKWQGQHLVLSKTMVIDEFTTIVAEYNFFMTDNKILYFKTVIFTH